MIDGSMMAIHPAIQYAPDIWFNIPENEHDNIARECQEHREQQGLNTRQRTQSQVETQTQARVPADTRSIVSDVTHEPPGTIMGGRTEQASVRSRNQNGRGGRG